MKNKGEGKKGFGIETGRCRGIFYGVLMDRLGPARGFRENE